jgi:hypothetical protein
MNRGSQWDSNRNPSRFHWDKISGIPAKKRDPNIYPGQNILGYGRILIGMYQDSRKKKRDPEKIYRDPTGNLIGIYRDSRKKKRDPE